MSKIDILMATYNGEQYVAEQIESLLWQSFEDWHLYISDDCSDDRTLEIVSVYARRDSRITVVSEGVRYGSAKANFMHLLEFSESPYVMFCDQDDVWLPDKIQNTIERMCELEDVRGVVDPILVLSDMAVVDEGLRLLYPSFTRLFKLRPDHSTLNHIYSMPIGVGSTFMMNKPLTSLLLEHADVEDMYMYDWWVTICAAAFGEISFINEPLSLFRKHRDKACCVPIYPHARSVLEDEHTIGYLRNVRQARGFRDAYSNILDSKDLSLLDALIQSASSDKNMECCPSHQDEVLEPNAMPNGSNIGFSSSATSSIRVACGIVTYEPNIERLRDNIQSIAPQVSCVYIYDNGSSNVNAIVSCFEEIQQVPIIPVLSSNNDGMPVALNTLSAMALRDGFEYIVLLDQDSIATKDMVKNLVSLVGEKRAIICPLLADRNNQHSAPHGGLMRSVKRAATSGSLLYLPAFIDVGGYDEQLFVDWVDFEFCDNLRRRGWQIVQTSNAVLIHEVGHQEPVMRGPGIDGEGLMRASRMFYRTNHPVWRVEDRARGQVITMRKYFGTRIFLEETYLFARMTVARCLVLEKGKLALLKAILRGVRRGLSTT